jgi:hypothetical protein
MRPKRAVNRVADAAGFRTALYAGLDVVGPLYATTTELGARFREIATTEGVPAAVRWRSTQFKGQWAPRFSNSRRAPSLNGHEERSTLYSSSGRYRSGNATFAGRRLSGRDAP